jgi:5-methylthioadenosine/S-adenosylhomocysteine deaminase
MMGTKTILLEHASLVTLDERKHVLKNRELLIQDGAITGIGQRLKTNGAAIDERIDCRGKIVIPGLVNAHSHLLEILQRSFRDNVRKEAWLRQRQITEEAVELPTHTIGAASALACAEMLKSGVTAVVDHFALRAGITAEIIKAVISAFERTGIRGILAPSLRDQNFLELMGVRSPGKQGKNLKADNRWQDEIIEALEQMKSSSTIANLMLGPSSPQNCSDALLREVVHMAERYDLGIHTHLLETIIERWGGRKLYSRGLVERIDKLGLLSPRLSAAHGVWFDQREMDVMARSGASVIHNPASNLKLGSGIAPVVELKRRGVNVAIGTDGGDTSDTYSIFEQMRLAAFLSRLNIANANHWLTAIDALRMGTLNGANAVPAWKGKVGRIRKGYRADLVILNPEIRLQPMNDVIHQLVYCEGGQSVETVLVDGKVVVRNGRLTSVDEKALVREVAPVSAKMYRIYRRSHKPADKADLAVQRLYRRAFQAERPGKRLER